MTGESTPAIWSTLEYKRSPSLRVLFSEAFSDAALTALLTALEVEWPRSSAMRLAGSDFSIVIMAPNLRIRGQLKLWVIERYGMHSEAPQR